MRRTVVAFTVIALVAAGFPAQPSFAQASLAGLRAGSGSVDKTAQVSSAIKAFPNGGPALRSHIADMIARDPDMASVLAKYLLSQNDLTPDQRQAVEGGLADALNRLGIVAQVQDGGLSPLLIGVLAVGGLIGLAAIVLNANKSSSSTPVSPN